MRPCTPRTCSMKMSNSPKPELRSRPPRDFHAHVAVNPRNRLSPGPENSRSQLQVGQGSGLGRRKKWTCNCTRNTVLGYWFVVGICGTVCGPVVFGVVCGRSVWAGQSCFLVRICGTYLCSVSQICSNTSITLNSNRVVEGGNRSRAAGGVGRAVGSPASGRTVLRRFGPCREDRSGRGRKTT